ncbi:MAG: phosphotransferase [Lachnospiraceae bacterium]|nr:phosphotransferase [Lachnospiraceae bacterium]
MTESFPFIDVTGLPVIGEGYHSIIYHLGNGKIVKVYRDPDVLNDIRRERKNSEIACRLGIPTDRPYSIVRAGSLYGLVFHELNAPSAAAVLKEHPERFDEVVRLSVDLLKTIHIKESRKNELSDIRERMAGIVLFLKPYLPGDAHEKLSRLFDEVPYSRHLIHGDFHVKNILIENGRAMVVDMDTLSTGHPVFEFSSMHKAYIGYSEEDPDSVERFLGLDSGTAVRFFESSLRLYLGSPNEDAFRDVYDKIRLLSYARILRSWVLEPELGDREKARCIEKSRAKLIALLQKKDSVLF